MYANAPQASVAPHATAVPQHGQVPHGQIAHGQPQGMPPAAHGGLHGMTGVAPTHAAKPHAGAAFVTGAYEPSGDPAIDRMIRLEAACKRFGRGF